jgi:NodT family efflux transporter outer membrane factor (OMF) lipoprotein
LWFPGKLHHSDPFKSGWPNTTFMKKLIPLLFVISILAGCAVPPPPTAEEALEQALPETTEVRETYASQQDGEIAPLSANFIHAFGDPQLDEIVDEALKNNLNLQAGASRVQAAAGFVTQAGAQMKPVVAAAGEAVETGYSGIPQQSSNQIGLSATWELDIWGKVRAQTDAAEADFEAATADYEFARLSLRAQVAKSWFTAVETYKQVDYAREVVELYRNTLDIVNTKNEFGEIGMKEVHLARADLASSQERLRQATGAHEVAQRGLEILLGRYPSAELEVAEDFVAVPPAIPVGLPSELIERRPDLVAAERRVAAAFNLTTSAKAARLPTIGLTAGGGAVNNQMTSLLGAGSSFWNVGANFLGPIYTGGALQAQVEIQTAQQEAVLADFGQKALVAFGEVETALSNEGLLREREELLEAIVTDNERALELAELQFNEGAIELLDVLQMRARVVNAKVAEISIRNARLAERINLHLALGGDFEQ